MAVGALFPHIPGAWRNYFSEKLYNTVQNNKYKCSEA